MKQNPLSRIQGFGQSVWLDYIRRKMIVSGELKQLIDQDGIRGVTSNPSIFDKVIEGSHDYDDTITSMALERKSARAIYQALAVEDVGHAADQFRSLHDSSGGRYGFVSLEVNPHLAHDTSATIDEARLLWGLLARPNVFIKVPGTKAGLTAIRQLISEGINVNVTLLFGLVRYREVAEAFIAGLEERLERGAEIGGVLSVASFFLSRIDVLVDSMLDRLMEKKDAKAGLAAELRGQAAIASARQAYQIYKEIFSGERFRKLARKGARPQQVLWASTSTKNPDYSDVKYVEALIGPDTINTMPMETIEAYRDHGNPSARLEDNIEEAYWVLKKLPELGIDLDDVARQLEDQGVEKFNQPFDSLMEKIEDRRREILGE